MMDEVAPGGVAPSDVHEHIEMLLTCRRPMHLCRGPSRGPAAPHHPSRHLPLSLPYPLPLLLYTSASAVTLRGPLALLLPLPLCLKYSVCLSVCLPVSLSLSLSVSVK